MSAFAFIYVLAGLLCTWALLRCMGNERERAAKSMEVRVRSDDREKAEKEILNALAAANASNKPPRRS